jgi:hypothetical protein
MRERSLYGVAERRSNNRKKRAGYVEFENSRGMR